MKISPIPFCACMALADCAARVFSQQRTSRNAGNDNATTRQILRQSAVESLRYLWATGDHNQRATVAARVAVWMSRPAGEIQSRVYDREKARFQNATVGKL